MKWGVCVSFCLSLLLEGVQASAAEKAVKIEQEKHQLKWEDNKSHTKSSSDALPDVDIILPKVTGLSDPKLEQKINRQLSLASLFDTSLEEIREDFVEGTSYVTGLDYEITYQDEDVLEIDVWMETMAAYPDIHHKYRLINMKTGELIKATDVFKEGKQKELIHLINEKKAKAEKDGLEDYADGESIENYEDNVARARPYELKDLDNFSIRDDGIAFRFDYEPYHATRGQVPDDGYFFTYKEIKPFVEPSSPLWHVMSRRGA